MQAGRGQHHERRQREEQQALPALGEERVAQADRPTQEQRDEEDGGEHADRRPRGRPVGLPHGPAAAPCHGQAAEHRDQQQQCQRPPPRQRSFPVSARERGQVAGEVGQEAERPVRVRHDLVAHVEDEARACIEHPRQVQDGDERLQPEPGREAAPLAAPAPRRIEGEADGQKDRVVLRIERRDCERDIGQGRAAGPGPVQHLPRGPQHAGAEQRHQAVHPDFLAVEDVQGIDREEARGDQRGAAAAENAPRGSEHERNGRNTGHDRQEAEAERSCARDARPEMQQRIVERRVDVLRGERGHPGQGVRGEPGGVAFVPPERLEAEPGDAEAGGHQYQQPGGYRPSALQTSGCRCAGT